MTAKLHIGNLKLTVALAALMAAGTLAAAAQGVAQAQLASDYSVWRHYSAGTDADNPAVQWNRDSLTLNRIALNYSYRHAADVPQLLELGNGHGLWGGSIDAFVRRGGTSMWGRATYDNGRVRNQKYCETADYELLYPYVMADTVGGGSSHVENYDFMGGVAQRLGTRFVVGVQGQYTACMDYRTRDPRPKNLSGYLKVRLGGAMLVADRYWAGLSVGYHHYKQTNEVKFYDEVQQPPVYHFTGLGTDYYRFRGDNTDNYYKGSGLDASLDLKPATGESGARASVGYTYMSIDKVISDLNQLPMTTLKKHTGTLMAGYAAWAGGTLWGVVARGEMRRNYGWENIFGSAQGNIYPQISSARKYVLYGADATLDLFARRQVSNVTCEATVGGSYTHLKETHEDPARILRANAYGPQVRLRAAWQRGHWLVSGDCSGSYLRSCSDKLTIAGTVYEENLPPLRQRYALLSHDRTAASVALETGYDTGHGYLIFARGAWQHDRYAHTQSQNTVQVSVGVEF